ncbi:major facilitator superfamily domain-containing protein [Phascolomyces articulosus]|uniref:Major facilitator superfamily domain-containing protein n=1 Tax=Phascolomyces articulosus TaxID=60185 RepID=A0AAD5KB73_9FUNG|nr:major facilitator superfamily domain-containing protein [Phascolomyces articulosus]
MPTHTRSKSIYNNNEHCNNLSSSSTATTIKIEPTTTEKDKPLYFHEKVEQIHHHEDIKNESITHHSLSSYNEDDKESVESYCATDDGGYGWCVVFGAFMGTFTIYGIMINHYVEKLFSGQKGVTTLLSLVGVLISFIGGIFAPISNMIESILGVRKTLFIATLLISGGFGAAGSATEIWQLYLALGICFGMGFSMMIMVTSKTVPMWFFRKRSTAMGIIASSGGLGGLILPFIITPLNSSLGISWTFRILAGCFFVINLITTLLVKEKNPPTKRTFKNPCDVLQLNLLQNTNFLMWCLAAFLQVSYMNMLFYFLPSYATYVGLNTIQGSALVSVTAASTFVGRLSVGMLADRAGNLNMCILFNSVTSLASFFIWTFAYDFAGLLVFAITHGFFGGCYLALLAPIVRTVLGPEKFPSGFALVSFIVAPAYAGPSIASALENITTIEPFMVFKLFIGCTSLGTVIVVLILKLRMKRQLWAKI